MAGKLLHDASKGFHDIKPLPEFSPSYSDDILLALGLLAVAVLLGMLWRKFSNRSTPEHTEVVDPLKEALLELHNLSKSSYSSTEEFKELITKGSLAFRRALECLLRLPAPEMTVNELEQKLSQSLNSRFTELEPAKSTQLLRSISSLLRSFEKQTYGVLSNDIASTLLATKLESTLKVLAELKGLEESILGSAPNFAPNSTPSSSSSSVSVADSSIKGAS